MHFSGQSTSIDTIVSTSSPQYAINRPAPNSFYLVRPRDAEGEITRLTWIEALRYAINARRFPLAPEVVYVGSGGSAKVFFAAGFEMELAEHIHIDTYLLSSGHAFRILREILGPRNYLTFILDIPKLITRNVPFGTRMEKLKVFYRMMVPTHINFNGNTFYTYRGIYDTSDLEERLHKILGSAQIGDFKGFNVLATRYENGDSYKPKPVVLNRDFPEMPATTAILAAIAMSKAIRPKAYDGHLFGDIGSNGNFPLLPELIPRGSTVIGVDLVYNNANERNPELPKIARIGEWRQTRKIIRQTWDSVYGFRKISLRQALSLDPGHTFLYIAPILRGIPPYTIHLTHEQIKELFLAGRELARQVLPYFRRPISISSAFQKS